jgi:hypothetical protein
MNDNIDYNAYPYKFLDISVRNNNEARVRELNMLIGCHHNMKTYKYLKGKKMGECVECKNFLDKHANSCIQCTKKLCYEINESEKLGLEFQPKEKVADMCQRVKMKRLEIASIKNASQETSRLNENPDEKEDADEFVEENKKEGRLNNYITYIVRPEDGEPINMESPEGNEEVKKQEIICTKQGKKFNRKKKIKCFVDKKEDEKDEEKELPLAAIEEGVPFEMLSQVVEDTQVKKIIQRSRQRQRSMPKDFGKEEKQKTVLLQQYGFELLTNLVEIIFKFTNGTSTAQDIADYFTKYIEHLVSIQKQDSDGKIVVYINGKNMIYTDSPLIGSSSIGFFFESVFDYDNIKNGAGVWKRPKSGAVYDFEFSSESAMRYVISELNKKLTEETDKIKKRGKKNTKKQLDQYKEEKDTYTKLISNLEMWLTDVEKPYNSIYVNLKVQKKSGTDANTNPDVASRDELVKLYLIGKEQQDLESKISEKIIKQNKDYSNCKTLKDLYDRCMDDEKDENKCRDFKEEFDRCDDRDTYVKSIINKLTPKMYMILKMQYDFVLDYYEPYIAIGDFGFTYIDAIFPYVDWTNTRLKTTKNTKKWSDKVPPYEEVINSIIRKEKKTPDSIFMVIKPKSGITKPIKANLEKYNTVITKGTDGQWMNEKEIIDFNENEITTFTVKEFIQSALEDKMDDLKFPVLIYNTSDKKFRVFK